MAEAEPCICITATLRNPGPPVPHHLPKLLWELVGYAGASLIALGVDTGLLLFLYHRLGWHYQLAAATSFTAGAVVAYLLSVHFVFHNHRLDNRAFEFGGFVVLGIAGLAVNSLAMLITHGKLGLPILPAKAISAACTFATNFVMRRQLLFTPAAHGTRP